MPTGSSRVNIYDKKLMPTEAWYTYFYKFLDDKINDTTRATFLSNGVLDDKDILLTGPADDQFSVDISDADRGIDGSGHIMDLSAYVEQFGSLAQYFENENLVDYWVGFRYQSIPIGIQNNPRSAEPEYPYYQDVIGELDNPDSVTDNGTYIRLNLNGMFESGVDHSRRSVTVYLDNPVAPTTSLAYYTGDVEYSDPNNYIDIPYTGTQGPLGQTSPTFPISTTASDYWVFSWGLSWFRSYDISVDDNYVVIGKVTGSGSGTTPSSFDVTDQVKTFLISLQRAYYGNSTDSPAPGRSILADRGSVIIKQSASSNREQDDGNTSLVFDKEDEDTTAWTFATRSMFGSGSGLRSGEASYKNIANGVELLDTEAVTMLVGTATVTFDRGAVDLTYFEDEFFVGTTIVKITGTTNGAYDGIYLADTGSIAAGQMDVTYLDFTSPSFPAGTGGYASILSPVGMMTIFGDLHGSSSDGVPTISMSIPKVNGGMDMLMYGAPISKDDQPFFRVGWKQDGSPNYFWTLFAGKHWMTSGSREGSYPYIYAGVRGHAHYISDKRFDQSMPSALVPDEADSEWGFDYRGSSFGKDTTDDYPPYQIGDSVRIPYSYYDAGNEYIHDEEAMSQSSADTLNLTRVGVDATYLPADSVGSGGAVCNSYILAEVEFDTPQTAQDGVYLLYGATTSTVTLRKFDGTAPSFASGTGKIRFYGGSITGSPWGFTTGNALGYVQSITPATKWMNGSKWAHVGDDAYDSNQYKFFLFCQNLDNPAFAVRDGGQVFGRSITTKSPTSSSGITQWDQVVTSLLHADVVSVSEGSREIEFPVNESQCNVITKSGGGSWTISKIINIYKFQTHHTTGTPDWSTVDNSAYIQSNSVDSQAKVPFYVPQGGVLTQVSVYVDPNTGNGTSASFGVNIQRNSHGGTSPIDLRSTGMLYASTATAHDMVVTVDQNNTINNGSYHYWVLMRSSDTGSDMVYSMKVAYTISALGENLFDCF